MAAAGALTSDHVNLMILRYLEEHGHENTAHAFWRDWHRPAQHRDPETLPFARAVHRNELVSVIQHGLVYDDLQARVRKNERRFRWTESSHDARDAHQENGTASSRPTTSSGKRRDRPDSHRPHPDLSGPAPKRQRRSELADTHVNGDRTAMDVDATSPSADADEDGDRASATLASEPDANEIMERYDSMDVATQTEPKTGPKTDTLYWRVDKPGATILHSMWGPVVDSTNAKTLLTVGESLCRFYQVPDATDDSKEITHADETNVPDEFFVTATAWRPDGRGAACAVTGNSDVHGGKTASNLLLEHRRDIDGPALELKSPLMEASGIVLSMQYSPDSQYLLVARTNLKLGWVQVWKTARADSDVHPPFLDAIAWHVFDSQVLDIAWTSNDTFLIGGDHGLTDLCHIDASPQSEARVLAAGDVRMRGLVSQPFTLPTTTPSSTWDKVRFDKRHAIAVFADVKARNLLLASNPDSETDAGQPPRHTVPLPGDLTALAFQSNDGLATPGGGSLLAATFSDSGKCVVYNLALQQAKEEASSAGIACQELTSFSLSDGPALALAWSPDGQHIAIGNTTLVQIWRVEGGGGGSSSSSSSRLTHGADALVTWRLAAEIEEDEEMQNGYGERSHSEPSLSWSADGESLAFAADNQVAVIRFRPPLQSEGHGPVSNGAP